MDLDSRSNQPFIYGFNGREVKVVFNGEIYNFLELRKDLISLGYDFNTNSDTEVICAAFLEWGYRCVDYFEGFWAIFLSEREDHLFSEIEEGRNHYISG